MVVGLSVATILRKRVPSDRAAEIHSYIREAALAFMRAQYTVILSIATCIGVTILGIGLAQGNALIRDIGVSYLVGSISSALVGMCGVYVAILSNIRVLRLLVEKGLRSALSVAFRGGSVTGFLVAGVGLLEIALLFIAFGGLNGVSGARFAAQALLGYAFGASTVALFARVGGGIYTKAADVGADLVGKVEVGIPEDDPRNPGVIADNVGDNVGDCAGMGADLFESFVESVVAAMVIGSMLKGIAFIAYPMIFAGTALLATLATAQFVSVSPTKEPGRTLTATSIISLVGVALATLGATMWMGGGSMLFAWLASIFGLITGGVVGFTSDYFTSPLYRPVKMVASYSQAGPALTILSGFSMGFYSTFIPIVTIALAAVGAFLMGTNALGSSIAAGVYAIALAGVGMLSMTSIVVSADAYGPIVDNTAGLSEQAGYPEHIRELADKLDSAGNTMKSISKGYAIGSAALTALALLFSYVAMLYTAYSHQCPGITIDKLMSILFTLGNPAYTPYFISGIIIGAVLPALFTAVVVQAVNCSRLQAGRGDQGEAIQGEARHPRVEGEAGLR